MHAHGDGSGGTGGPTRRRVLIGAAVGGTIALAGCMDGGSGEPDDAGAGSGDDETDTTGTSIGAETDETETDASAATDGFQQAVRYEESFAMTGTMTSDGRTVDIEGRFDGESLYWRFEQDGQVFESYRVGGDQYMVTGGRCFRNPNQDVDPGAVDPETVPSEAGELPDVTPAGRTTIDGETMLVYEFAADEAAASGEGDVTYYVSAETGYIRRVEGAFGVLDYHSWGSVQPIEPPDMDCQSA